MHPKVRTACDRCYVLKERCQRATPSAECGRCERLGLACSTVRPVRPVGRRAHKKYGTDKRPQRTQPKTDQILTGLSDHDPEEKALLSFLLVQPGSLDHFVVCPSFQAEQQHSLAVQLPTLPLLKDAFLACAATLKHLQSGNADDLDAEASIRYISKAVNALRSLPASCLQDAAVYHQVGSLLAFSIHSSIGAGVAEISRYCLSAASSIYNEVESGAHTDPWQSFLILQETMDCILYRQKPTIRINTSASSVVDRRLGLCLPLLPHYQDLCVISNSILYAADVNELARLQKQLDDIRRVVEPWQPPNMDQLLERFESAEIVHLLAQAKLYRLGALLLGHRLRYPFGQQDAQGQIWSREIFMELEMAKRVTKRTMRFVTLPFVIAAVEAQGELLRLQALQLVHDCVDQYAPSLQKVTKAFLSRIWHERDMNLTTCWFDSTYKPCPILNSINGS
ncbi:hypothetical protein PFICI_14789 [Pestalotiopsis fici W106-1]|uniref:Zn(2)-C6 fungal-type domain-containing protein n=1 Tax=Pestalotiopsis fici (strain W106-1 / CGMCC3.15140) TaxID=1229662 RepID=W3WIY5_PESFW|nr:uncharacterized protein PFICI_14789 [Pestalotiopsis fici W106-1]ETS73843.1 hypothetical protein PFICI_14789 [Pestalotiopsis fici W106-1]